MHQLSHPARHYIYYRLSRRNDTLAKIVEDLGSMEILLPQDGAKFSQFFKTLQKFAAGFKPPSGFDPTAKVLSESTVSFLRKWGIHGMWLKDAEVQKAEEYLYEGPIRYALEVMLLGPIAPHTIAERIRYRFSLTEKVMNTSVVRAYSHYFWDYGAWSPHMWATAIFEWMPKGDKTALLMALRAPRTATGAAMVLGASDGDVESLDPADMFEVIKHYGWRMFMQHATTELPSFPRTQAALAAFQIVEQASDAVDRFRGTGNKELLNTLGRIAIRPSNEIVASIYDVPAIRSTPGTMALPSVVDAPEEAAQPSEPEKETP